MEDKPHRPIVKKFKPETKRLEGLQRELYSLIGENTPPIAVIENKFRDRPNWRQKPTPWSWSAFKNPARDDDLVLHHWVRGLVEDNGEVSNDYGFSKLNQKIQVPKFTEQEYETSLDQEGWTFEESKYLFELCEEYDLRWIVIHDRYSVADRTIEDLKERYYSICQKLMKSRQETLSPAEEDLYKQMNFSKDSEILRKEHLKRLLARSPAEIAEEEALVVESRKLEAAAERMLTERNELLRLLDAPQASGSIAQYQNSQGIAQLTSLLFSDKTKRRKDTGSPAAPVSGVSSSTGASTPTSVKQERKGVVSGAAAVQQLIQKRLTPREEAAFGISYHDKVQPGVYLRSTKIGTFKPSLQAKINTILNELGVPLRPVMPTERVCARFDTLQQKINLLVEVKKQADKLQVEKQI